jgi:hypothetical protein
MARPKTHHGDGKNNGGVSLRQLKKELKLIPNDIKREMRFLDLLFAERGFSRTRAEREVLMDFIDGARKMVEFHQDRLERYQKCYDQLKKDKTFDMALLFPEELQILRAEVTQEEGGQYEIETPVQGLRTGTDG